MTPSSSLVVVLPFVPVTPTIGFGSRREPSSTSLQTGIPRSRAAATSGASPGTPGLLITVSTASSNRSSSVPRWSSTPASASLLSIHVLGGVDADHLDPAAAQRERGRLPGASEP